MQTSCTGATVGALEFKHQTLKADGLRFHFVESGSGPLVILLAGFPQSWFAWRRVIPLLAVHHHVIAVDLPGQGDSEKPIDGYDTRTTSQRIHSLVNILSAERYFLVGHDIGAWVGYAYAAQYENELRGLALLDGNIPGVTLEPSVTLGAEDWRNWHFIFNRIADLPEALLAGRERILIEWFFSKKAANFSATFSCADINEYQRVYQTLGGLRGMLGYYRAVLENIDQNRKFAKRKLEVPILALG